MIDIENVQAKHIYTIVLTLYKMEAKDLRHIEDAQLLNVTFVFVILKVFFYDEGRKLTVFDVLFSCVLLTRLLTQFLSDTDSLLLSLTSFLAAFFAFLLCVDGHFVTPAVVTFMLLALTGSCFMYSSLTFDGVEATPTLIASGIIFAASATILLVPNEKEEERHSKNRVWLLIFFIVHCSCTLYMLYEAHSDNLTIENALLVSMLIRVFISLSCVGKTFDRVEEHF
jgi:hypothetical protein